MSISVIIPTLNEARIIGESIQSLRLQQPGEIIVADGGSSDGTVQAAKEADRVIAAGRGRALQMNAGAALARGDILLYLHADCSLEAGALAEAARLLRNSTILAGCFAMSIPAAGWQYRLIEACAAARVRVTGLAYGDQGLFLRRLDFERLAGFPPLRFMEDVFFSRRLRAHGRVIVASKKIMVSPRRWQKVGLIRQTLRNWTLTALAAGGVHPDVLARYYPGVR
jgi:rSAM/selenodomain-associated transferase 2